MTRKRRTTEPFTTSPRLHSGWVWSALAILAVTVAACGSGKPTAAGTPKSFATTTTNSSVGSSTTASPTKRATGSTTTTFATTPPTQPGSSTTVLKPSTAGTSAPTPTTANLGPARTPSPAHPPTVGDYRYKSTDPSGDVTQVQVGIRAISGPPGGTNQSLTISTSQGSEMSEYNWAADSVMVSSTTLSGKQGSIKCNWTPDIYQYQFPIKVGTSWSSNSNCTTSVAGAPAQVKYTNQANVTGIARIEEAGEVLDTWVIHRHTVLTTTSAAFTLVIDAVSTEYLAPNIGQIPKELTDTKTNTTYGGKTYNDETTATIEAETLTPS